MCWFQLFQLVKFFYHRKKDFGSNLDYTKKQLVSWPNVKVQSS